MATNTNCLFALSFTYQSQNGLAVVAAATAQQALVILKNQGQYNGAPSGYVMTTYKNLGVYKDEINTLIFESYVNAQIAYDALVAAFDNLVIPSEMEAYDDLPLVDGTASAGTSDKYARGDHRHPSDSTKQDTIADLSTIRSNAASGASAYHLPDGGIPEEDLSLTVRTILASIEGAYHIPSGGIPASELASAVRDALALAESALQEHQSLADYYTKAETDTAVEAEKQRALAAENTLSGSINSGLSGKIDKVHGAAVGNIAVFNSTGSIVDGGKELSDFVEAIEGKGLSTNDFTDAYKERLDNFLPLSYDASDESLIFAAAMDRVEYDSSDESINIINLDTEDDDE